jgi:hypoxanthine phosphoribosyltransferase
MGCGKPGQGPRFRANLSGAIHGNATRALWIIRAVDLPRTLEILLTSFGVTSASTAPGRILISRDRIAARVRELGAEVKRDYEGRAPVILVVLKGSFVFAADLARAIDLPLTVEFLGVQSYGDSTDTSGVVRITLDLGRPIEGQDVLIVEDIVDTGLTSRYLLDQMAARKPRSVKLCALLHKPARTEVPVDIAYLGFTVEDVFIVGYGLDVAQSYRNLPDLCVLENGA